MGTKKRGRPRGEPTVVEHTTIGGKREAVRMTRRERAAIEKLAKALRVPFSVAIKRCALAFAAAHAAKWAIHPGMLSIVAPPLYGTLHTRHETLEAVT